MCVCVCVCVCVLGGPVGYRGRSEGYGGGVTNGFFFKF